METPPEEFAPPGYETRLKVPESHWEGLAALDPSEVCRRAKVSFEDGYSLPFLNRRIIVDVERRSMMDLSSGKDLDDPLLLLIALVYLRFAVEIEPENVLTAARELKEWHFFTGIHDLDVGEVLKKFGDDPAGFATASRAVGGEPVPHADAAFKLLALPRIPLYYLLWAGDEDFPPNITVCFDRTIERHFAADAIWGLVKRVSYALVHEAVPEHD